MRGVVWFAVGLALAVGSGADAAGGRKSSPANAYWQSTPAAEDYQTAYKGVSFGADFYGALVRCHVDDDGGLSGCRVVRETPAGSGFGAALLSLTPKFKRKPPKSGDPRDIMIADDHVEFDTPPDWLKRPTAADLIGVFPREAFRRGIGGAVVLSCVVTVQGALNECVALEETPAGAGFGGAAVALTPQFLMRPATLKGKPVPSMIRMPVTFPPMEGRDQILPGKKVANATLAWTTAPTFADVAAAYPAKAREEKRGGRATLTCSMTSSGRLAHCNAAVVEPKGYGFDAAAKALAERFTFPISTDEERKAARSLMVHLPVTFDPAMLEGGQPVVGKPLWAELPKMDELLAAFRDVKVAGVSRAMLECGVLEGGGLDDCKLLSESPAGAGVGAAALRLAPRFRMSTWTTEGLPVVGGRVRIPLRYDGEEPPEPAS